MLDIEDDTNHVREGQSILILTVAELIQWILEFRRYFKDATQSKLGTYCSSFFGMNKCVVNSLPLILLKICLYGLQNAPNIGQMAKKALIILEDGPLGIFGNIVKMGKVRIGGAKRKK
ncbi:hypothetical protein MQW34_28030 (plasmid) [Bacillus sp. ZJS3]|nr:hypothetical protein [Bacillus sp. ZJS3]UOB82000.1 hypothetical protein MQW34_28030 [Bacillus sp. ZJS3]